MIAPSRVYVRTSRVVGCRFITATASVVPATSSRASADDGFIQGSATVTVTQSDSPASSGGTTPASRGGGRPSPGSAGPASVNSPLPPAASYPIFPAPTSRFLLEQPAVASPSRKTNDAVREATRI